MRSKLRKIGKKWALYSLAIGLVLLSFGLLELASGFSSAFGYEWSEELGINTALIYPDIFSGLMLIIIGIIFLFGVKQQWRGNQEAAAFLVVGVLLATVFFGVYLAIMGAHAVGNGVYHAFPEGSEYAEIEADYAEWTWMDDMRPGIWLFAFVLPGLYLTLKLWRAKT
jgi:hypothetical protein